MLIFYIRSDASQASQLLREALRPPSGARGPGSRMTNEPESKRSSSELSTPLQRLSSARKYNLHGLADTQSQTPVKDGSVVGMSDRSEYRSPRKQKQRAVISEGEGCIVERGREGTGPEEYELPEDISRKPRSKQSSRADSGSLSTSFSGVPTAGPSRIQEPPSRAPSRYTPRPVQPALQREDSFAGPLPEKQRLNAFMRESDAFSKPISKLGLETQTEEDPEEALEYQSVQHPRSRSYFVPDSDSSQDGRSNLLPTRESQSNSHSSPSEYTQGSDYQQGQAQESGYVITVPVQWSGV